MKICGMSDLHGYLPPVEEIEDHEVTLICGDISPLSIQINHKKMRKWLINEFKPWCESLPSNKVYFIAGNHDELCESDPAFMLNNFPLSKKVSYLWQSGCIYHSIDGNDYKIWGTPYCKVFGNWSFMESDDKLEKLYSEIPKDLDILLCHDQPYGYGDILLQPMPWNDGNHIGNKILKEAIENKQPKYLFTGHLHSTSHDCVEIGITKRYNVSIKDEKYNPVYEPLYLEITK